MALIAEILLGLFILAFLVVAGINTYNESMLEMQTTTLKSNIIILRANIENLYRLSYLGINNQTMVDGQLVPTGMLKNGDIKTPWGDLVLSEGPEPTHTYKIEMPGIPSKSCQSLASQNGSRMWGKVVIGSTDVYDRYDKTDVSMAEIIEACNNKSNTLTFIGP